MGGAANLKHTHEDVLKRIMDGTDKQEYIHRRYFAEEMGGIAKIITPIRAVKNKLWV
jgi:hypothetical protein